MRIAVVGITGLVGSVLNELLSKSTFEITEFIPVASSKSVGKKITFRGEEISIIDVEEAIRKSPDVAIFSAGATLSKEFAPKFAEAGTFVVDNSSAWRMDPNVKLVVPEINAKLLTVEDKIIANPNCSTIQMVVGLAPLHREYKIKRLVISTYQSFTGTGSIAVEQYHQEKLGNEVEPENRAYPHKIFANAIPHCDVFLENKYTKEEMKLVHETRKILGEPNMRITATAVRIPVFGGHSESVNVEFENDFDLDRVVDVLSKADGVIVEDDISNNKYPMPLHAHQKDEVFVGRIRRDESNPNTLNMWIVSDNLRKGAATNAVQIVKYLIEHNLIRKSTLV